MSFHDAYARTTPLEMAFPDEAAARAALARIADEAEARGADTGDLGAFAMLVSVTSVLRDLGGPGASQEAILQHASLLFHAYHALRAGTPVQLVSTRAARLLTEDAAWEQGPVVEGGLPGAPGGAFPLPPAPAGYVQLPRHLFWIHPEASGPAEAVDGFFWTWAQAGSAGVDEGGGEGNLHLLLASGIHEGRPGLTVAPLPAAPVAEAGAWITARCRSAGEDFANTLPGGELGALLAFTTAGEVFKLAARLFAHLARTPGAATPGLADEGPGRLPRDASPAPSRLAWVRVGPGGEDGADA